MAEMEEEEGATAAVVCRNSDFAREATEEESLWVAEWGGVRLLLRATCKLAQK